MHDFSGRTVLVTGAGAGIGRATAEKFGSLGAKVAVMEIDPGRAEEVRAALDQTGVETLVQVGDASLSSDVAALAGAIEGRFGGLDALVNNVGDFLTMVKPFEEITDEEIARLYAVNLGHVFLVTRAMIPLLKRKGPGGSIVSVTSVEGFRAMPNLAVYGAFKTALVGFTKSLSLELGPAGIRVNLIAPESTDTLQLPITAAIPEEHRPLIAHWTPLGRFGTPEDMANGIVFLSSPLAAWITGTTLHIDGGSLAAGGWYREPGSSWTNLPVITGPALKF